MSKPREFWILKEDTESLLDFYPKVNPEEFYHVREVVPIDWDKVFEKVPGCHQINRILIKQLVEKHLAGEE